MALACSASAFIIATVSKQVTGSLRLSPDDSSADYTDRALGFREVSLLGDAEGYVLPTRCLEFGTINILHVTDSFIGRQCK